MEFLEKLYSIDNFGIYLFVVIGVLVVLFLIILFFGKKDEKKRKTEETQKNVEIPKEEKEEIQVQPTEEIPEVTPPFKEVSEPVPVEAPINPFEQVPPIIEPKEEPIIEPPKEEKEFDFDALANAISKELESIEKPVTKETIETPVLKKEENPPLKFEVKEPVTSEVEKKEEVKIPRPAVFSSVYVNREKEQPVVETSKEEEIPTVDIPVAPKIELPKMIDLPKKNK